LSGCGKPALQLKSPPSQNHSQNIENKGREKFDATKILNSNELMVKILIRKDFGYSGESEHRFQREAERHSGVKVNSSRSEAPLTR
jgi:hypothetical protein